jgi:hypothetical protein
MIYLSVLTEESRRGVLRLVRIRLKDAVGANAHAHAQPALGLINQVEVLQQDRPVLLCCDCV